MSRIDITADITAGIDAPHIAHGLVFGKFMPPTNGHVYLIDFARRSCRKLTIVVLTLKNEPIPGILRYNWVREMFPDCTVVHHDHDMPQEPKSPHDIPFYHAWRDTLRAHCPENDFDALFASEDYGYRVAWALGIRFIPVDTGRGAVEISGTAMRRDPWQHWQHLHPVVRPYFLKRVGLQGATAAQRNVLAQQLAAHYQTRYVADYGTAFAADLARNIADWRPAELDARDMTTIARGQRAAAEALARQSNRVMFTATTLAHIAQNTRARFGAVPAWMESAAQAEKFDIILSLSGDASAENAIALPAPTLDAALAALANRLPPALPSV